MCDSGADISIINEKLLNKLKTDKDSFEILPYHGNQLNSCSGKITVFGSVTISQCIIDTKFILKDIQVIATNQNSRYDCILGRDLINKILQLKNQMDEMKKQ